MTPAYPDLLPAMSDDDYQRLKADIAANGLKIPIEIDAQTHEILDGWHRYRAWLELGRPPSELPVSERRFASEEERKWFSLSLNLLRRHLTVSQLAAYITEYRLVPEERKALERKREGGRENGRGRPAKKDPSTLMEPIPGSGEATEILAKEFGISATTISETKRVRKESPALFAEIKAGKRTTSAAVVQLHPHRKQRKGAPKRAHTTELSFCEQLLAELRRKRKEARDTREMMRWRPEGLNVTLQFNILEWIEQQLEDHITRPGVALQQRRA
jgi:ParB-like chromosome segregation protein Spo0J